MKSDGASRIERARRRRWADVVVIAASCFAIGWAIWMPPQIEGAAHATWWTAHGVGGALGLVSLVVVMRSLMIGRVVLAAGGIALLFGLTAFETFRWHAIVFLLLPGLAMLAAVPFFGPMPTPEEEGKTR